VFAHRNKKHAKAWTTSNAFTLVELILVMALLIMAAALVTPQLSKFFGARDLDSEVRRFVALTRYGQNRAVSEGVPMLLWIDTKAGKYGLQQETGYTDGDTKSEEFSLADGLHIGVENSFSKLAPGKRIGIRFSRNGNTLSAGSVASVYIQHDKDPAVWIVLYPDHLSYEAQNEPPTLANVRH